MNLRKALRKLLLGLAAVLALLVLAVIVVASYRLVRQHQNEAAAVIATPPGVDESNYVRINGIDQWVRIRGEDRRNPVLLFLHGGPGSPLYPVAYQSLAPLERHFIVVHWDQRGAGRTYGRNGATDADAPDSLEQMADDAIAVAEYLREHLGQPRLGVVAASAGSPYGLMLAHRRPDLLYAYVGAGQVINMRVGEQLSYDYVLRRAQATGNQEAIAVLERIGRPPYEQFDDARTQRKWLGVYSPVSEQELNAPMSLLWLVLTAPGYRVRDIKDMIAGSEFTAKHLVPAYDSFDAAALGLRFEVPMLFFQGDEDHLTSTSLVADYVEQISAPHKQLVLFPGSGHSAIIADPQTFLEALLTHVRPLAATSASE